MVHDSRVSDSAIGHLAEFIFAEISFSLFHSVPLNGGWIEKRIAMEGQDSWEKAFFRTVPLLDI